MCINTATVVSMLRTWSLYKCTFLYM